MLTAQKFKKIINFFKSVVLFFTYIVYSCDIIIPDLVQVYYM